MADTIIERETRDRDTGDSTAGWAVAVIVLIAVIVFGGLYLYYHRATPGIPNTGGTNVNVTVPSTGGTTGASGGGTGTTGGTGSTY